MKIRFTKNYSKISLIVGTIVVMIIFVLIFVSALSNLFKTPINYCAFASMEELSAFDEYAVSELEPTEDKRLDGLNYVDKYTKALEYKGEIYQVYAYQFESQSDAQIYCFGSSKNETVEKSYRYSYGDYYVAFYHEYAYIIHCTNHKDFAEFYNMVTKEFSIVF